MARVVGYASSALFDRNDPLNPVNRRIDIVVLTKKAQRAIEGEQDGAEPAPATAPQGDSAVPGGSDGEVAPDASAADEPLPAGALRERLNIFEDGVLQADPAGE